MMIVTVISLPEQHFRKNIKTHCLQNYKQRIFICRSIIKSVSNHILNISVIFKHWANLKNAFPNKIMLISVFVLNFVVLGVFMLIFGYLEISPVLEKAF